MPGVLKTMFVGLKQVGEYPPMDVVVGRVHHLHLHASAHAKKSVDTRQQFSPRSRWQGPRAIHGNDVRDEV